MAYIKVEDVTIDLPILGHSGRSMRKLLVNIGTGGRLMKAGEDRVIVRALQNVDFELNRGDRLGLIGHNGCGKTTLLRVLAGIYEPTMGKLTVQGRISSLLDTTFGLNTDATGRENIRLLLTYRRLPPKDIAALQPAIEDFTELGSYLDLPVRTYSAGMFARLAFAVATSFEPEILIMDEWLMAGDAAFMQKAEQRINDFVDKASIVILASHADDLIRRVCNKVLRLEQGRVVAFGPVDEVLAVAGPAAPVAVAAPEPMTVSA